MTARHTKAYVDARHLLRRHQETHGKLRGVIARKPTSESTDAPR